MGGHMAQDLLKQLLAIPSPTFHEAEKALFIEQWMKSHCPRYLAMRVGNSLIFQSPQKSSSKPHLVLVGHSDTVPAFFEPFVQDGKLYGSGASDMLGGVAAFMVFLRNHVSDMDLPYRISLIVYAKEEGTPLDQNGLFDLIQVFPDFFKTVDAAIVGEPTDGAIQLGCMGSLHVEVKVHGKACHSARPWQGKNALYEAIPLIQHVADFAPRKHHKFGVEFVDVLNFTQCASEPGRTSIPGYWVGNINFRYSPGISMADAEAFVLDYLRESGVAYEAKVVDNVYPGDVIETSFFTELVQKLKKPITAKQAWTDVAQLTQLGIPSFNYGPGLTDQAHKSDEHIVLSDLDAYLESLESLF